MSDAEWTIVSYPEHPRRDGTPDVALHDEHWRATLEIEHGYLSIEVEVDGDARDTRESIPMSKVIEFLRACGYEVMEPARSPRSGEETSRE